MQLIDVNSFIPQIERAPHKIYILELTLEELQHFKIASKHMLKRMEPFSDIDDKTNIHIDGIDGDKGALGHGNVKSTHAIVMDFRPLAIKIVMWEKPTISEATFKTLTSSVQVDPIKPIRKT